MTNKLVISILVALTVAMTIGFSCGNPVENGRISRYQYVLDGVLVKDMNSDVASVSILLDREGLPLETAEIKFGDDMLVADQGGYNWLTSPATAYGTGAFAVSVKDSTSLSTSFAAVVADTLSITNVVPERREKRSNEEVLLEWSGSANADGYIIAAVKAGDIYTGNAFSQYVTSQTTSAQFVPEAFTVDNNPANEIDPGLYYLYVYAYSGSADSALCYDILPTPLPGQLADNVNLISLDGRFGSVVVSAFDSMMVLAGTGIAQ